MIIFGLKGLSSPVFKRVRSSSELENLDSGLIGYFDFDMELLSRAKELEMKYATQIKTNTELLISTNFLPEFLLVDSRLLSMQEISKMQKIIEHYVLDSKLLCVIEDVKNLESFALEGIDGVIFRGHLT